MQEQWKIFEDWPYLVSNFGRVRRIDKKNESVKIKCLKNKKNTDGYLQVRFCDKKRIKNFSIASLVIRTFIGERPVGLQINHKDGNKLNNHIDNLEYVTVQENIKHAFRFGLNIPNNGEKHGMSKLTEENVLEIRRLYKGGMYKKVELAKKFNISRHQIYRILNKEQWSHI